MTIIKAIVFDMDGVLIDAKEWHYCALNRALNIFGEEIGRGEHNSTFDGLPTKAKLQVLSKQGRIPSGMHNFLNELKQKYTMEIMVSQCRPNFVHQHALSKLKSEGYSLAVASNSIRNTVRAMMDLSALTQYLDFYLSNDDVAKSKPSPDIYLLALEKLGLKPSEVIVLEDNNHGFEAARAANCNLLEIKNVDEVNYKNIRSFISRLEGNRC